jgi:hypothetical protein
MATSLLMAPIFASTIAEGVGTNVRALVQSNITLSNTNTGNTDLTITGGAGVKQSIDKDTVTVATNDPDGYTLKLQDGDTSNHLCLTPGAACTGIGPTSGTGATPAFMATANTWGYHIDNGTTVWCSTASNCGAGLTLPVDSASTSTTLKYALVPLSSGTADTLKATASTTSGDNTAVFYGVNVDASQAAGTYSNTVVYTATVN